MVSAPYRPNPYPSGFHPSFRREPNNRIAGKLAAAGRLRPSRKQTDGPHRADPTA